MLAGCQVTLHLCDYDGNVYLLDSSRCLLVELADVIVGWRKYSSSSSRSSSSVKFDVNVDVNIDFGKISSSISSNCFSVKLYGKIGNRGEGCSSIFSSSSPV